MTRGKAIAKYRQIGCLLAPCFIKRSAQPPASVDGGLDPRKVAIKRVDRAAEAAGDNPDAWMR